MPGKLRAEYSGILAWAVRGCLEWQRHGLGAPEAVSAATKRYRNDQDVFARFLDECCIRGIEETCPASNLLDAFKEFAGFRVTSTKLGRMLSEAGFGRAMVDGRVRRLGIDLKPEFWEKEEK